MLLGLLVILWAALMTGILLDQAAALQRGSWPPALFRVARGTTNLGKSWWILLGTGLLIMVGLIVMRKALTGATQRLGKSIAMVSTYIFSSVALAGLTANLAKRLIGRARPEFFSHEGIFGRSMFSGADFESFPSGHSTTAGALAGCLAIVFPRARVPILLAGALMAITRVIVGAHFPSDVVAGFGYGIWFSVLTAHYFRARGFNLNLR